MDIKFKVIHSTIKHQNINIKINQQYTVYSTKKNIYQNNTYLYSSFRAKCDKHTGKTNKLNETDFLKLILLHLKNIITS